MTDFRERRWAGMTCVCIASGPSLSDDQLEAVRDAHGRYDVRVIAVSDNYRRAPWADVIYAGDLRWWQLHGDAARATGAELWTQDWAASQLGVNRAPGANGEGLGRYQVNTGGNSGYQAINLAYLWGCRRILLIGYDMQATGGRKHWFGDHPRQLIQEQLFDEWLHRFKQLAVDLQGAGVTVLNCTAETALTAFPRADIREALCL